MSENEVTVPDFQSLMTSCLQSLADEKVWSFRDITQVIAENLGLTDEQQTINLGKTGTRSTFTNNVNFALSYLFMAGLLEKPQRAHFQISCTGQALLEKMPERITVSFLNANYPAFAQRQQDWRSTQKKNHQENNENGDFSRLIAEDPPEMILEKAYDILCAKLATELLEKVKGAHWRDFEWLVMDLLIKMGYGGSRQDAGRVVGQSGDKGVDGIINEDKLGLDVIYVQAKHYTDTVSHGAVRDFIGALKLKGARKGIFITTSSFAKPIVEDVANMTDLKVILIDGQRLAELMIEYNVGVVVKDNYEIKRIDYDYFDENG